MAVVSRYLGILTVDVVVFFRNPSVFHSQDSFPSTFRPRLWETSSGVVAVGVSAAEARRELQPRRLATDWTTRVRSWVSILIIYYFICSVSTPPVIYWPNNSR